MTLFPPKIALKAASLLATTSDFLYLATTFHYTFSKFLKHYSLPVKEAATVVSVLRA